MKNLAKILSNRNLIKPQSMTFGLRSFSINRSQKLKLNPLLHEFYAEVSNNRIDSALELYGKLLVECESSLGKDVYSSLINALDPRTGSTHLAVAEGKYLITI